MLRQLIPGVDSFEGYQIRAAVVLLSIEDVNRSLAMLWPDRITCPGPVSAILMFNVRMVECGFQHRYDNNGYSGTTIPNLGATQPGCPPWPLATGFTGK